MIIKRIIEGKEVEIVLTQEEVSVIFYAELRKNKISDITSTLCSLNLYNIDPETVTDKQAELLVTVEDALQESLISDISVAWESVYEDYESELNEYFTPIV